ncbi:MAG: hypothetical protein AAGA55_07645 [Planctomycetota bacterium]
MSAASGWTSAAGAGASDIADVHSDGRQAERSAAMDAVEVTWAVARSALNGTAPSGNSRMLAMTVRAEMLAGGRARVTAEIAGQGVSEPVLLHDRVAVAVQVIPDIRGQVHVEIPGWLHLTIGRGRDGDAWRLIYARTPLLERLRVPGGRAEPTGVSVIRA